MRDGAGSVALLLQGLGLPSSLLSLLIAHADAVREASPRLGLVSTGDETHVLSRHTADALRFGFVRAPAPGERWADLGSGGGFPGLVLAACYPETTFALIESSRRKAGFLEVQVLDLGLANTTVIADRADRAGHGFDVATARAVDKPEVAMRHMLGLLRPGGTAMFTADIESLGGVQEISLDLPVVDSASRLFMLSRQDDE